MAPPRESTLGDCQAADLRQPHTNDVRNGEEFPSRFYTLASMYRELRNTDSSAAVYANAGINIAIVWTGTLTLACAPWSFGLLSIIPSLAAASAIFGLLGSPEQIAAQAQALGGLLAEAGLHI